MARGGIGFASFNIRNQGSRHTGGPGMRFSPYWLAAAALPSAGMECWPEDPLGCNRLETKHRDGGWSRFNRSGATVL
jgi:hypothetical protein